MSDDHPYLELVLADYRFNLLCREQVFSGEVPIGISEACISYCRQLSAAAWAGFVIEQQDQQVEEC
jgi:hypothetical protein